MKTCSACKRELPETAFYVQRSAKGGLQSACKACQKAKTIQWQKANPASVGVSQRRSGLKKMYGLTLEQYNAMLTEQGGVCKICGRPEAVGVKKTLSVDHDHQTGAVRGLLCNACNTGLGSLGEDAARLRAAADYLDEANGHG